MANIVSRVFGSLLVGSLYCLGAGALTACGDDHSHDADGGGHGPHDHEHGDGGDHEHMKPVGPATGATCPDGSTLTYENFGKKFMQDYCLRCHSVKLKGAARMNAPEDHNFDEIEDIDFMAAHIDQKAGSGPLATNRSMPLTEPKPTDEERKKLSEWLACGVID